ncbi:enterochelin esterase domain-containing protein [Ornithinicoccus hortensis]|uniref:Enterochelin esterase family protein n=1 Tax=Ornithinicoccus hortensis TaxID=82346 RepID=A0A542YVE9_9MICO|nr:enterochelin esterase domain-containing protein [Ornithinicoccus hortensis]TQL52057.1 enterochelin esterase family protein [Ornithinicoccus hortensis]
MTPGPTALVAAEPRWLTDLADAPDRAAAAGRFWAGRPRIPVIGEGAEIDGRACRQVTFLWRQEQTDREVMVHLNGITDAHREDITPALLQRMPDTDLWHRSLWLPAEGTWGYRIVEAERLPRDAGATREGWLAVHRAGRRDPGNPRWLPHALGAESSVLVLPEAYQHPAWLDAPTQEARWTQWQVSDLDGEPRTVRHRSPGGRAPQGGRRPRLLVLFDGEQWAAMGLADALDRAGLDLEVLLIDSGDPGRRAVDLPEPGRAAALVEASLRRRAEHLGPIDPEHVIIAGQSFGGLAAAAVTVTRPDLVGQAIVQSGSFWYVGGDEPRRDNPVPGDLVRRIASGEFGQLRGRFVVQAGTDEGTMVDQAQHFRDAVVAAGAEADLTIVVGGHDFAWWTHHLLRALDRLS